MTSVRRTRVAAVAFALVAVAFGRASEAVSGWVGGGQAGVETASPTRLNAAPTVLVAGFENRVADKKWRDFRLGMGLAGRLEELLTVEGDFALLESRELVQSVREATGGRWVREQPEPLDLGAMFTQAGVEWIASGTFEKLAVTRDRVTGLVSARRFLYRAEVSVCLRPAHGRELCARGSGESKTTVIGALIEYRGSEVAFDQAGPAQAIDRALTEAGGRLLSVWRDSFARPRVQVAEEPGEPLPIYVAAFDVAAAALRQWPALREVGVGLGLANRIADAVDASGRFRLLEEKAELVERLAQDLGATGPGAEKALPEAAWLLYGEVTEVTVEGHEKLFTGSTDETRVRVQLRLVERATRRVQLATGEGSATSAGTRDGRLDAIAVAEATGRAVADAAARLAPESSP